MTVSSQDLFFWVPFALLFILVLGMFVKISKLNNSFAKLGFFVRDDAKKYFKDAADGIQEVNAKLQESNQAVIEKGVSAALQEAEQILEPVVKKAHDEASEIILESRIEAQNIIEASKQDANANAKKVVDRSSEAIRWIMNQYAGETLTDEKHEELVKKLLDEYINESRIQ